MHDGLLISPAFWLAFALYVVVERGLRSGLGAGAVHWLNVAASAAFLWAFTNIGVAYLFALYAALSVIFFAARATLGASAAESGGSRALLFVAVVSTVWALGKIGASLELSHFSWLFFLGASFLLVKIWSFSKDFSDGRIESPRWGAFLSYCTFFPCFISGPMHYYNEFTVTFEKRSRLDGEVVVGAVFRILHGLVKVLAVGVALRPFSLEALAGQGISSLGAAELLLRSVVYSLVIYLDFSGYSDIAISSGRLLGIEVPENFRMPYLAANLRDFWQRWHITFTRFLTQYLFIPFVRVFQARSRAWSAGTVSAIAYLVTFAFCGFWHGSTANFLAWGLYHGLGLAAYDLYRRKRAPALLAAAAAGRRPAAGSAFARGVATLITFLFVSLGWVLFTLPLDFWGT